MSGDQQALRERRVEELCAVLCSAIPYERLPACLSEDHRLIQNLVTPDTLVGPVRFEKFLRYFHGSLVDWAIWRQIHAHEGDTHWARLEVEATHKKPLGILRSTGQRVVLRANALFRFYEDRIAETWLYVDAYSALQQLDAIELVPVVHEIES